MPEKLASNKRDADLPNLNHGLRDDARFRSADTVQSILLPGYGLALVESNVVGPWNRIWLKRIVSRPVLTRKQS